MFGMEVLQMESMEVDSNENQLPRSRLVVDQKLQDAKLEPTNFLPTAQCVFFNDDLDNDGVRLLELDGDLLRDLEAGKSITVKGEDDENCVLVTDDKTYELRSAETSNLLLVTRDFLTKDRLKADAEEATRSFGEVEFPLVRAMFSGYLETRPIKPKLQKLRALLEENLFRGLVEEKDETRVGRKFTKEELVAKVSRVAVGVLHIMPFNHGPKFQSVRNPYAVTITNRLSILDIAVIRSNLQHLKLTKSWFV